MKRYGTIYADPPWQVKAGRPLGRYILSEGKQLFGGHNDDIRSRDLAYPSMTVEEICTLPVSELAADSCHLYIWVINKYLPRVFEVISAWGFTYSCPLTWAKKPMGGGLGGTFGQSTEHLIFATKGKVNAKGRHVGTSFDFRRPYVNGYPCHSKKPDEVYGIIEKVSHGPYLELFARQQRQGWDVFGNQVENSITIQ